MGSNTNKVECDKANRIYCYNKQQNKCLLATADCKDGTPEEKCNESQLYYCYDDNQSKCVATAACKNSGFGNLSETDCNTKNKKSFCYSGPVNKCLECTAENTDQQTKTDSQKACDTRYQLYYCYDEDENQCFPTQNLPSGTKICDKSNGEIISQSDCFEKNKKYYCLDADNNKCYNDTNCTQQNGGKSKKECTASLKNYCIDPETKSCYTDDCVDGGDNSKGKISKEECADMINQLKAYYCYDATQQTCVICDKDTVGRYESESDCNKKNQIYYCYDDRINKCMHTKECTYETSNNDPSESECDKKYQKEGKYCYDTTNGCNNCERIKNNQSTSYSTCITNRFNVTPSGDFYATDEVTLLLKNYEGSKTTLKSSATKVRTIQLFITEDYKENVGTSQDFELKKRDEYVFSINSNILSIKGENINEQFPITKYSQIFISFYTQ